MSQISTGVGRRSQRSLESGLLVNAMALTGVLTLLAAAMLVPGLIVGPSLDAAVFSHIGGQLLDGVAPYAGTWDHKPPGIYLASAAIQFVLGWLGPWTAGWLLSLATSVGIGLAVGMLLARLAVAGWPRTLAACGATILASQYLMALGGGLTEPLATFLVALAVVVAVGRPTAVRLAEVGVLVGLSILVSVQLVPAGAVICGFALLQQRAGERPRAAALMALGFGVPLLAAGAWLFAIGALPAAVDALVTYSGAYRALSGAVGVTLGSPVAAWTVLASLFLVAPALLGAMSLGRARQPRLAVGVASVVWIGVSLVVFLLQGRFYAHYAIPLSVPLGMLAGLGLERVGGSLSAVRTSARRAVLVLPLFVAVFTSVLAGVGSAAMEFAQVADGAARISGVLQQLRDLPAGTMLVWGNQPGLYDRADRAPATRYSYMYPLTTPGYGSPTLIATVARELAERPPAVVVDAGSNAPGQPGFLPLLIDRPIATDGRDLDVLDPLRAFVATRYRLAATVAGWPIYVLR